LILDRESAAHYKVFGAFILFRRGFFSNAGAGPRVQNPAYSLFHRQGKIGITSRQRLAQGRQRRMIANHAQGYRRFSSDVVFSFFVLKEGEKSGQRRVVSNLA
jgi:hypothetical protein